MFFKTKKTLDENEIKNEIDMTPEILEEAIQNESIPDADVQGEIKKEESLPYTFYKPDPYPKDLVSVIGKLLQKSFPDAKKAYLLEAHQNDKKGYLVVADIDAKFLKIINLYLTGETKKLIGETPIECILYSKSGAITEGIDPFYRKESAESKANDLTSGEFSGDIVFSRMPEFELWTNKSDDTKAKVKPVTKEELFSLLNEYGERKTGTISTVAMAAIREFEFYIPYSTDGCEYSDIIDSTLPIDDSLRFKKLVNPEDEISAVPLFTEADAACEFAKRDNCRISHIKYKDFASSMASELTGHDGVIINPALESIYLPLDHQLLS